MPKGARIDVRVSEELKNSVREIYAKTGLSEAELVIRSLQALSEYFYEHGELRTPWVLVPAAELNTKKAVTAPVVRGGSRMGAVK